jgi:hypothetical protein
MKNKADKKTGSEKFPGYPHYPQREDIYNKDKEETELNPENPTEIKREEIVEGPLNEKDFSEDVSGQDLDVPGSEADDVQEEAGSEDEENNYYSLGGENHDD